MAMEQRRSLTARLDDYDDSSANPRQVGSSFVLRATISKGVDFSAFLVFMGVALSITAFPVLARILAELKLLTTEFGRLAMSAASVNDVATWVLLALALPSPVITSLPLFQSGSYCLDLCLSFVQFSLNRQSSNGWLNVVMKVSPSTRSTCALHLLLFWQLALLLIQIGIHAMFGAIVSCSYRKASLAPF